MFWGWPEECPDCRHTGREATEALVAEARRQREGRRQERIDSLEVRSPVPYNEFPDGF
jgi:hypothetical protein